MAKRHAVGRRHLPAHVHLSQGRVIRPVVANASGGRFHPIKYREGSARSGTKELLYFLGVATGSLAELDTQLDLVHRLKYCAEITSIQARLDEVSALTLALMKSLKDKA